VPPDVQLPAEAKILWKSAGGNPNWAEKTARSLAALGASKASTIAIARDPADGFRVTTSLYTQASEAGVFQE
jgi:hypothetical protein